MEPWHRGADDQAQRMTPGTSVPVPRHLPRNLRHNANRARPSTGKHTPRLGHTVPRARERRWPLTERGASETHYKTTHASSRGLVVGGIATSLRVPPVVRFGRRERRGGEQGTQL